MWKVMTNDQRINILVSYFCFIFPIKREQKEKKGGEPKGEKPKGRREKERERTNERERRK